MNTPAPLRKGDSVMLAATARKVSPAEIQPAVSLFEQWGLNVVVPQDLFEQSNQFAGTDQHRAELFQAGLDNPDIKAIIICRGGYGTVRMVDKLNFSRFAANPQWIVGFSDVTVLHSHIQRNFGIPTLHATMPIDIPSTDNYQEYPSLVTLRNHLFGLPVEHQFLSPELFRAGTASAPVVGGNLSILYSLLGSNSDIDTRGKILMIEDLDEYLYHIDRMLQALRRSGKLEGLAGLVVGQMSDMHDNAVPFGATAQEIIWDAVSAYSYPVAFNAPFGHVKTQNCSLKLGAQAQFTVAANGTATLLNS